MPDIITAETVLAEHDDDIFYCGDSSPVQYPTPAQMLTMPDGALYVAPPSLLCVRPEGHRHDHAAVIDGVLVATWPQEATVAVAEPDPRREEYRAGARRWADLLNMRAGSPSAQTEIIAAILDPVLDRLDNVGRSFVVARSQRDDARRNALDVAHALDEIRRIANEVR